MWYIYSRLLLSYNAEWCKRISMNLYQVKLVMFEEIHESARKKKKKKKKKKKIFTDSRLHISIDLLSVSFIEATLLAMI